ncbi:MAG: SDR family oxidoreductase [Candidatus Rokubacteria bacterium]|nr:SDR family oxidoreductase [Candidatus Rokubacteria bacterium]
MTFTDKAVLVTGATSGIGRAATLRFAAAGARVALVGRDRQALDTTRAAMAAGGDRGLAIQADITREEDLRRVADEAARVLGGLDVLVSAAGVIGTGSIETTSPELWDQMMAVNVRSVFRLVQLALPALTPRKGNIVVVSSVNGQRAFPNVLAYCCSKAAVDQFVMCASLELAPKGIRINAVNPGVTRTNLHRRSGMSEADYAAFVERSRTTHPIGRVGEPEEVADMILFLASDRARMITGNCVFVDGGRHNTCAR